ncbi:MAG: peptidoglycan DD-metalloendopeptidase family protein [Alphaproteobacteria bacterium]
MKFYRYASVAGLIFLLTGCSGTSSFFGGDGSKTESTEIQAPVNGQITVQRGDTVYAIARKYGVPVRSIIDTNNLEPPFTLTAGQALSLPAVKYHVAERGDTVYGVARGYGVSPTEVVQINNLRAPYALTPGQEVRLPAYAGVQGGLQPRVKVPGPVSGSAQTATATPSSNYPTVVASAPTVASPTVPRTSSPTAPAPTAPPTRNSPAPTTGQTPRSTAASTPTVITPSPSTSARPSSSVSAKPGEDPYASQNGSSSGQQAIPPVPMEPDPVASAQSQSLPPPPLPDTPSMPASTVSTSTSSSPTGTQVAAVPANTAHEADPPRESGGSFLWPINGKVLSNFGPKDNGLHNDGINIGAPRGTPIKVSDNGTIAYVGNELRGFGNLVLVRHADGWITAYAHCEEIMVKVGDQVKRGQVVARVGSTGGVDQPQLHFELRKGKQPVNPRSYLTLS